MSAKEEHQDLLLDQFEKISRALAVEYRRTRTLAQEFLNQDEAVAWAEEGLAIAKSSFRSWEAATEYFRVAPQVIPVLRFQSLIQWARWGRFLARDSATLASSYFRASPGVLGHLQAEEVGSWARLGRRLYKGTWKSGLLACAFFEAGPKLVSFLSLDQVEALIHFLDVLAAKSYEAAAESLGLAASVLQSVEEQDRKPLLGFLAALAENQWRDAKVCFEAAPRILPRVEKNERGRFLSLARRLARFSPTDALSFYFEGSKALSEIDLIQHGHILGLDEQILPLSPGAAIDFLRSVPTVLKRVRPSDLDEWMQEGFQLLKENRESGQAFFRLQSASSLEYLNRLSTRMDLQQVREVLRMYCHALTARNLQILSSESLVERGIGWTEVERAATEGNALYLPPFVDVYDSKEENFDFYKVIATHQASHIEYRSFDFRFDAEGKLLPSRRHQLAVLREQTRKAQNGGSGNGAAALQNMLANLLPDANAPDGNGKDAELSTDISRFYDLFDDRQLISDLFLVCEDTRVDAKLKRDYKGLRRAYQRVQQDALANRPNPAELPLREAIMELLVQASLDSQAVWNMTAELGPLGQSLREMLELLKLLQHPEATVEDSAEVALRLYELIAAIPNVMPENQTQQDKEEIEIPGNKGSVSQTSPAGAQGARPDEQEDETSQGQPLPYHSPQHVPFRGEFKPELVQLLAKLTERQGEAGEQPVEAGALDEALQEMLKKMPEIPQLEAQEGEIKQSSQMFVSNLMREAKRQQQAAQQQRGQFGEIKVMSTDDRVLTGDAKTFFYDEWDYRVRDYRPKWCLVRERELAEGSREFFTRTLRRYSQVVAQIRRQFEMLNPERFRKVKRLQDGEEFDLDALIEDKVDRRAGNAPSDKVYWRRNKVERDVAVVFLLDMSASTAEDIDEVRRRNRDWDDDPWDAGWPRTWHFRRPVHENYRRIIDVEKESLVLLIRALETIGDTYGIYGFSGYGRDNVEFYVIKDIAEQYGDAVERKVDKIAPVRGTRMGPAIRHATTKLENQPHRTKVLFLISDGRPQDLGYGQDGTEKEYAIHDTHMALVEAKRKSIVPFCLTVDKAGHDYLKQMCDDMGYEVVADIESLPLRLPSLYRRLTR